MNKHYKEIDYTDRHIIVTRMSDLNKITWDFEWFWYKGKRCVCSYWYYLGNDTQATGRYLDNMCRPINS